MPRLRILAAALAVCLAPPQVDATPMGSLHCNNALGQANNLNQAVTVTGVVTVGTGTFASSWTEVYLQDPTGAINLYKNSPTTTFALGDSFTVVGTIIQYRGLTEISPTSWTRHASGAVQPEPTTLTCAQVAGQFGTDYCEPQESMLIRLERVSLDGRWPGGPMTLYDETGTCMLYIDWDTDVNELPGPMGNFDIVGVLKQYGAYAAPWINGYEIIPRSASDVVERPGPKLLAGPAFTQISPNDVVVTWTTDVPSSSKVDYGTTTDYEFGTVYDSSPVTEHLVTLTGLEPAIPYLARITSSDANGDLILAHRPFMGGSRSSGEILACFNKSVDPSVAIGEIAVGGSDLAAILIDRVNAAEHSIDVAIYSFDLAGPADALIAAHQRGVHIRFVTDYRSPTSPQVQRLINAGIRVIDDTYGALNNDAGEMHHKFWVFDHRYDDDPQNDWVLTGSWNVTQGGTYTDAQNIVLVQDEALAQIYTMEIDELWGSTGNVPDQAKSRFSHLKRNDTPKTLRVGGRDVRVYFGPSDQTMSTLTSRIYEATASAHFSILSFTRTDVEGALKNLYMNVPGPVRGVFDSGQSGQTIYQQMKGVGGDAPWNPAADVWLDQEPGFNHHKYMILDAHRIDGRPTVITGSSNWSNSADESNDENMIYIEDFNLANLFYQEFAARYHAAGGSQDLSASTPELAGFQSSPVRIFPNPIRERVHLRLPSPGRGAIELTLHDAAGRRIAARRIESPAAPEISWEIDAISSGIYFLRIESPGRTERRVLTIVR